MSGAVNQRHGERFARFVGLIAAGAGIAIVCNALAVAGFITALIGVGCALSIVLALAGVRLCERGGRS